MSEKNTKQIKRQRHHHSRQGGGISGRATPVLPPAGGPSRTTTRAGTRSIWPQLVGSLRQTPMRGRSLVHMAVLNRIQTERRGGAQSERRTGRTISEDSGRSGDVFSGGSDRVTGGAPEPNTNQINQKPNTTMHEPHE